MNIKLNGTVYAVGVASVSRTLRRTEKYRVTTEDGRTHREVQATYMDFALNLGSFGAAEYDRLMSLLRSTTVPIGSIALNVGFGDVNYFSRVFKSCTGKTPTEYRAL